MSGNGAPSTWARLKARLRAWRTRAAAFFFDFPEWLDRAFRSIDLALNRGDLGFWARLGRHGHALHAALLPSLVLVMILFGPTLTAGGTLPLTLAAAGIAAVLVGLRALPSGVLCWVHLGLVIAAVSTLFLLADPGAAAAGGRPYRHWLGPAAAALAAAGIAGATIGVRVARRPKHPLVDPEAIQRALPRADLFNSSPPAPRRAATVLRAYVTVVAEIPYLLVLPAALAVLLAEREQVAAWGVTSFVLSFLLLAAAQYDDRLDHMVRTLRRLFMTGTPILVTAVVILFAALRLAGVDYVTTVLDTSSGSTLALILLSLYAVLWFYDYWPSRLVHEQLLGLLDPGAGYDRRHRVEVSLAGGRPATVSVLGSRRFLVAPGPGDPRAPEAMDAFTFFKRLRQGGSEDAAEDAALGRSFWLIAQWLRLTAASLFIIALGAIAVVFAIGASADQRPQVDASAEPRSEARVSLARMLDREGAAADRPLLIIAASGGGTRAALYAASLLEGLVRREALADVGLVSSVSGGSAAAAWFAANRDALLADPTGAFPVFHDAMAHGYFGDVLRGVFEARLLRGARLGHLLAESFDRQMSRLGGLPPRRTLRECRDVGLIFNTSVVGQWSSSQETFISDDETWEVRTGSFGSALDAGGRLVFTNLDPFLASPPLALIPGWRHRFPFVILDDGTLPLAACAAASANFPPVFSDVLVAVAGAKAKRDRWMVTDGGAVENRGILSVLFALHHALATRSAKGERAPLREVRIILADASAISDEYVPGRGLPAVTSASTRIANALVAFLLEAIHRHYRTISGCDEDEARDRVRIVELPMPGVLRRAGAFGTHWMLPLAVKLRRPPWKSEGPETVTLDAGETRTLIRDLFKEKGERSTGGGLGPVVGGPGEDKDRGWLAKTKELDPAKVLDAALKASTR